MSKQPSSQNKNGENNGETNGRRPKIGLALGSGIARGWAHIGVLRAMERHGIIPDVIVGTSIGAVVGGSYATGSLDQLELWARNLSKTNFFRFLDFRLMGGGLFGGTKLHEQMIINFGTHTFEELDIAFAAVACELSTGHEIWLREGKLIDAIQASFALPGVFEPFCHDGRWLVDGALVNPVPVSVCRALGAEMVIAVNLTEDIYGRARAERHGMKSTGRYGVFADAEDSPSISERRAARTVMGKLLRHDKDAPSIFANMVASLQVVQNRLARSRLAGDPPDVAIVPKTGHIGLMEFHRAEELIEIGAQALDDEHEYILDALEIIDFRRNQ